jgi:uracil-DNA glycosylase
VTERDVELTDLLVSVRPCAVCAPTLPFGPRPVIQASSSARIVIIGQAPGRKVHLSGVPWDDPSGKTLRSWLGVTAEEFYDPTQIALIGMGLCYPGSTPSGDKTAEA